ncbi:AP-1 complex subunit gamma-2-like isoform X2 [Lolium rigidum]|uniref:AP-1 complex subunit gamma-2-like isoform X2 n=1 Tax=Lolium rigidum TaxID=89674 RepID=UPI001F5E2C21|nr:AP-1 complex subunit gamma-2-like isoform X2 [Lolium rigidum]XP_051191871.1 AP-1 complex subunit gamma-2-like isoform X2 [Lolium perenne]
MALNPFSSGTRLRDMIRAIRASKTAAEERAVVRRECAAIRTAISERGQEELRHRNMAKLMFIHMLGYPTHFGQMECLKLIAAVGYPEKRIGYLGLMLLLDERQEVLMLVTNSLKQDLNHSSPFIVGLALCALGNICSAEMARDLAPEVEKLLRSRDVNTKKKAALCSVRIVRKVPDLAENFMGLAASLLKEKHHGVLISAVQLCTELCKASKDALEYLRKNCIEGLVRILRDVSNSSYAPEYDVAGISDPFLHIRVLKLMRMLGQGDADCSEYMNDILAQVATKTESNKNAGNAILYECVETIMGIEATSGLRVLAINILGRFLSNRDNNIRYVALNILMRAITVDTQAVQRHRVTILECVKDADASIRKRALELVFLLVNDTNVKPLTKELVDYLDVADPDFKEDLTAKICSITEKFSQEKLWYLDQMFKVLSLAGNHVKDDVWHALIVVISNASELQGYAVRSLYTALRAYSEQGSLLRVAVWCIGEYGEMLVNNVGMLEAEPPITVTESDAVDAVELGFNRYSADVTTRSMCLVALLKLSSRFPSMSERIKLIVAQNKENMVLELQQRSIEFGSIIQRHQSIRSSLLERMPVLDEAAYLVKRASATQATTPAYKPASRVTPGDLKLPNGVAKPAAAPLVDLLDLSSDDAPVPSTSATTTPNDFLQDLLGIGGTNLPTAGVPSASTDILMDLLSIGSSPSQNGLLDSTSPGQEKKPVSAVPQVVSPVPEPIDLLGSLSSSASSSAGTKSSTVVPQVVDLLDGLSASTSVSGLEDALPSITAFQSATLKIVFDLRKQLGKPQETTIHATFTNLTSTTYTDFIFQAAVPKFIQLRLDPASGNVVPASGKGSVTQGFNVTNSQHGQKPLAMRIRMSYKVNGEDRLEQGQVSNFPLGL